MNTFARPAASFARDVRDDRFSAVEDAVLTYFRDVRGYEVRDVRRECWAWDFEVRTDGGWKRIDVKADSYLDTSFRVAFEDHNEYRDGTMRPTWGQCADLDFVVFVGLTSWRAVVVGLKSFRRLVNAAVERGQTAGWRDIRRENEEGYVTVGWAVPLDTLFRDGAWFSMIPLSAVRDGSIAPRVGRLTRIVREGRNP